ncbi:hypothetical protein [Burkholderia ubonensis]|uniref:hypothetical protein n=1 Tax=Burkholderia ubonensis TaxID=101571 RepID=UPI0012F8E92D|nr:hypothetical protein [Burkholderia ubonensis]
MKGIFRGSPVSGKCKAASRESLMPVKRSRVNQHKAVDYFLHRSKRALQELATNR